MSGTNNPVILGDTPVAGFYCMSLVRGGPMVPVRVWHGAPIIDGEEQDRSHRWNVEIDGKTTEKEVNEEGPCQVLIPVERAWPYCARRPISEQDYRFMVARSAYAKEWKPNDTYAQPRKAVGWNATKPVF